MFCKLEKDKKRDGNFSAGFEKLNEHEFHVCKLLKNMNLFFFARLKKLENYGDNFSQLEISTNMNYFFWKPKKLKNMDLSFCKLEKAEKHDSIFCELGKPQKTLI